jgi:purine nucleosidase
MVQISRRTFAASSLAAALAGWRVTALAAAPPMARVICDNDWSGDPDGLFQLAHHILSPAIDIPLIVGSNVPTDMPWTKSKAPASEARAKALELIGVMRRSGKYRVLAGSETAISSRAEARPSPASAAIIAEAMRADAPGKLVYAAGAGLTELALAWLAEPRIGPRIRLIWIGGNEHPGLAYLPPGPAQREFNLSIDPLAAQVIFNESDIEIWQVPRNAYRQMLVSSAELAELAKSSRLGRYLVGQIDRVAEEVSRIPFFADKPRSETYVLGDSPLVTLTALQTFFEPDPASSSYSLRPTPRLGSDGSYADNSAGRPMRVYTQIDTRLTFADMVAKFRAADSAR